MATHRPQQETLFGAAEPARNLSGLQATPPGGHAARPGTGPSGETCGSCAHCVFRSMKGSSKTRNFYKCGLMAQHWTYRRDSDVLKTSPACSHWKAGTPHETSLSRLRNRNWEA